MIDLSAGPRGPDSGAISRRKETCGARVDGLEPPTNVEPHGGSGRPSFWERPSRALPDRKGPPWDEQLGSVVWSAVNATGGQIRDSPPHQCRPATGPLLVFDGTGATPAKAQIAWTNPRFVVGRVLAWIDYIHTPPSQNAWSRQDSRFWLPSPAAWRATERVPSSRRACGFLHACKLGAEGLCRRGSACDISRAGHRFKNPDPPAVGGRPRRKGDD
jgi:hypothetical protein